MNAEKETPGLVSLCMAGIQSPRITGAEGAEGVARCEKYGRKPGDRKLNVRYKGGRCMQLKIMLSI